MTSRPDAQADGPATRGKAANAAPSGVIAVTGASGFVGRRLVDRLLADGRPVVAISRHGARTAGAREAVVSDYANAAALAQALIGVDCVVHLAARAHAPPDAARDTQLFHQANVQVTRHVAEAAVAARVRRIVLVSSIGVHGNRTRERPFRADDRPAPAEPYAVSKWQAEQALVETLRGRVEYVILRPPLVYGPGCPGNFDKLMRWVAHAPLVPFGALNQPRSFIFVDNLVDALLVAGRHPAASGGTYLVADGSDVTVAQVVRRLAAVLRPGRQVVRDVPQWLLQVMARLAGRGLLYQKLAAPLRVDASAFSAATGWRAPFDPVRGIDETARQFRDAALPKP